MVGQAGPQPLVHQGIILLPVKAELVAQRTNAARADAATALEAAEARTLQEPRRVVVAEPVATGLGSLLWVAQVTPAVERARTASASSRPGSTSPKHLWAAWRL